MSFNKWKTKTMHALMLLAQKYQDQPKKRATIDYLINKLRYLRSRDLPTFLFSLHYAINDVPELREIIPTTEEIEKMLEEDERDDN